MLQRRLSDSGYDVHAEPDGHRGLRAARDRPFDLVLHDLSAPRTNALEVLRRLKDCRPDVPVIVMIAPGSTMTALQALRLGAYHYVTTPVRFDEIRIIAERALEQRRLIDENRSLKAQLDGKCRAESHCDPGESPSRASLVDVPVTASLRDAELFHIRRVLQHAKWNQSAAALVLGIDRKTLRNKIREFRLRK